MKIRTDFVTNSSSQSYITVTIDNPELAKLCKKYKTEFSVSGDTVSYYYNDLEGSADWVRPKGETDFVDWLLRFVESMKVADKKTREQIEANRVTIEEAFVSSAIVAEYISGDPQDAQYWEETRDNGTIELMGFDTEAWDAIWNTVDHNELEQLYDGNNIDNISPSSYPFPQLISDNWGLRSVSDKDQIFIRRMIYKYGTSKTVLKKEIGKETEQNKIIEYSGDLDNYVSVELKDAEKEWKVKIVKKTKSAEISEYTGQSKIIVIPAFVDNYPVKKVGVISKSPDIIREVIIPHTVESLTQKTFKRCRNLNKLTISEKTDVPFGAFEKCDGLADENGCVVIHGVLHHLIPKRSVVISEGVREIPDDFENHRLEEKQLRPTILLNERPSEYEYDPSSKDGKINSIVFPESLIRIGKNAFKGHRNLSKIVFKSNLREIDDSAFACSGALREIAFNEGLEKLHGFERNLSLVIDVKVPDSVKDFNAFRNTSIGNITLPKGITEIPHNCFSNCPQLKSITIPEGVKTIGEEAFSKCINLRNVYIPDSVEEIGARAFEGCSQAIFHYNHHKMSFPEDAFDGCDGLTDLNGFQIFNGVLIRYKGSNETVEISEDVNSVSA